MIRRVLLAKYTVDIVNGGREISFPFWTTIAGLSGIEQCNYFYDAQRNGQGVPIKDTALVILSAQNGTDLTALDSDPSVIAVPPTMLDAALNNGQQNRINSALSAWSIPVTAQNTLRLTIDAVLAWLNPDAALPGNITIASEYA